MTGSNYHTNSHLVPSLTKESGLFHPFSMHQVSGIEEMRIYWGYINNKFTNANSPLSVEHLHRHLTIFVQGMNKFVKTAAELKTFLDILVEEGKLTKEGLLYRLKISHN